MQGLIVGWQMYELTHDPLALGLIGLAEALPFIAVALYAGHVADRYNRKRIMGLFSLLFFLRYDASPGFSFDKVRTMLAPSAFFRFISWLLSSGIARAFIYPSTIALMAQIVPRELYANASTWNSTVWHIAAITGPALGA